MKTFYDGYLANDSNMIKSVLETDYQSVGYPAKENIRDLKSEINFINAINNVHTDLSIEKNSISTTHQNGYKVYVTGIEKFKHNETGNSIDLRFADIWTLNKSGKIISRERFQDVWIIGQILIMVLLKNRSHFLSYVKYKSRKRFG